MVTQVWEPETQPGSQITLKKYPALETGWIKKIYITEKVHHSNWVENGLMCGGGWGRKLLSDRERKFAQAGQYKQFKLTCGLTDWNFG